MPERSPQFLTPDELPILLANLAERWQPLFATAIFTGMRKGELLGLRKSDVHLASRRIQVCRSYDHETTKPGDDGAIPIAQELVPFLERALATSASDLVFPEPDGGMMREDVKLEDTLRRALARGGIVQAWQHVCRKKDCGHQEKHDGFAADHGRRRHRRGPAHPAPLGPAHDDGHVRAPHARLPAGSHRPVAVLRARGRAGG